MEGRSETDKATNGTPAERHLDKLFSQLPKGLGVVNGSKKSVRDYLAGPGEKYLPERTYTGTREAISALLAPRLEWPSLSGTKKVIKDGRDTVVRNPSQQPRILGIQNLFPLVANMLRPDRIEGDHEMVTLNIGMGADIDPSHGDETLHLALSPALPGYALLGIARLEELLKVTNRVRLRLFSTGSLNAILNKKDPEKIKGTQDLQRELLEEFIHEFYPHLSDHITTTDITRDVPLLSRSKLKKLRSRVMASAEPSVHNSLVQSGMRYGATPEAAIKYATYHLAPGTFRDGTPGVDDVGKYEVTIGGYSEYPFMAIRGFNNQDDPQCRVGIVVRAPLAKTPAYLHRPDRLVSKSAGGKQVNIRELTMSEILDRDSARVKKIIDNPHGGDISMFVRKDLAFIGRALGGRGNEGEGIARLQDFYMRLYNGR